MCTCVHVCVYARGHVCEVNELSFFLIFTNNDAPPINADGWNAGRRAMGAEEASAYERIEDLAERDSDEHNYEADEDFGAIDRKSNISIVH